ncbi:MAG: 4Fe-4S binding protein [Oscillospiraceae bacterium]|jgi:dissimilatory sulfite reductase (desulfoviridin) alpha/beta subunit|nr:4Fe-4S binding protein [Oscillospiraceae bacterium]
MAQPDYALLKKGGFMRQKQKDYFSLRLAVTGGNLTAAQLSVIAETAKRYGRGAVHMTARQGVEIPFIHLKDIADVKAALAAGGVAPGVCGPRVRTVTACQGSAVCPGGCIETAALARELHERYFGRELPHKFKFGITGCQNNCLKAEENDFGIKGGLLVEWQAERCIHCGLCEKVCRSRALEERGGSIVLEPSACNFCGRCVKACPTDAWKATPGYMVSLGGLFGNQIRAGKPFVPFITDKVRLMRVADKTLDFFTEHGRPGERFRFTAERAGWETLIKKLEEVILCQN